MRIASALLAGVIGSLVLAPLAAVPAYAEKTAVSFSDDFAPGTIIVRTSERRLYLVVGSGKAFRYPVGVGRAGRQWAGNSRIVGKYIKPDWIPPAVVRADNPKLPGVIKGGSSHNPMGAAAMVLGNGTYAIHGTNRPDSIGGFVSYGCIRMFNGDILDLYSRVAVGTPVVVTR